VRLEKGTHWKMTKCQERVAHVVDASFEVRPFLHKLGGRAQVFSKRGMSLERPDLGDARSVDPL